MMMTARALARPWRGVPASLKLMVRSPMRRCALQIPSPDRPFATASDATKPDQERIISALVVNRPGTLAQIADVFGYAQQNISGLCVRSTVVPELSRVTISCRLADKELAAVQKRLKALVCVTFFHMTTMESCVRNQELLLRSQILVQIARPRDGSPQQAQLTQLLHKHGAEIVFGEESAVIPDEGASLQNTDDIVYDKAMKSSAQDDPVFVHLAEDPAKIDEFITDLRGAGFKVIELQGCGPLFLHKSNSTLDAKSASSFSFKREVASEVEKLSLMPPSLAHTATAMDNADEITDSSSVERLADDHFRGTRPQSTFQIHANEQGYFSKERLQLHARIAHQLYAAAPQDIVTPRFVLLIGIPGAGKSTILSHLDTVGQLKLSDFVNFDVDEIIALLPEFYHAMLNIGLGNEPLSEEPHRRVPAPQTRYQMCRDEAKFILRKNLYSAIMCRKNIILHGSGKSFNEYASVIDQVKAAGFDVHVVCLDVPLELAYERVEKRSSGYGRNVPRTLIDFTSSLITRNFPRLASRVPNAHLFDSNGIPPRLVWSKHRAVVIATDPADPIQQKYKLR